MKTERIITNDFTAYLIMEYGFADGMKLQNEYNKLIELDLKQPFCTHEKEVILSTGEKMTLSVIRDYGQH